MIIEDPRISNQPMLSYAPKKIYVPDTLIGDTALKHEQYKKMIITVTSGTRFYADPDSRADIVDAIEIAKEGGYPDTTTTQWKTPDGLMNVTLADLKEVRVLRLNKKAEIIGV